VAAGYNCSFWAVKTPKENKAKNKQQIKKETTIDNFKKRLYWFQSEHPKRMQ